MNNYLTIVPKYLSAHKKKTWLTIISVAISVALITSIFSMMEVFLKFEKAQVIHDVGNYHIGIKDASSEEKHSISSRIDVQNAGTWESFENGTINGVTCRLGALDKNFAENMNIKVIEGKYPTNKNEIMLERWATERFKPAIKVNDTVKISFQDNVEREFVVSGIYNDSGHLKATDVPGVLLSIDAANEVNAKKMISYMVEFKEGAKVLQATKKIKSSLDISDDRIGYNTRLLGLMGQSRSNTVTGLYVTCAVLFCIVLVAGIMMIYNTFNISVMERVRQFGLLRCIGASESQIKKMVKREGLYINLKAIPIGVLAGIIIAWICSAILKFYNNSLFGDISLFNISITGIAAGVVIGVLTVFVASLLPAKKAAQVSPVNAVTGSNELKIKKSTKQGLLTKMFHAETAMGINNAVVKKKTLILMSCSIAISIIMFFGFNVLVDFMHTALKTTKPYTPDISITAEKGISNDIYKNLSNIDGIKKIYGRNFKYVDVTFNAAKLTDKYKKDMKVQAKDNSLFVPPESSWLISYDKNQLNWAKEDLIDGILDEKKMNNENGIIVVINNAGKGSSSGENANLKLGDKVYIKTPTGTKQLTVMGILRSVPFNASERTLGTFITTEKLFTQLTGESTFKTIDMQLNKENQEQTVNEVKGRLNSSISFFDSRQNNAEMDQNFFTMAVFMYGFVAIIAFISILNIINTMNTSVASKTKYLGVMRAIGMSGDQLNKMVLVEAGTYSFTGTLAGCILGIILQKFLVTNLLSRLHIVWEFPLVQTILIFVVIFVITVLSVISPLKRIKDNAISEVIGSL